MSEYTATDHKALNYCTWCPRLCHFSCPAALGEGAEDATAWGMMTLARAVERDELPATPETSARFFSCASCHRCQAFCVHGNDVPGVLARARAKAVSRGHLPDALAPLARDVALRGAPASPEALALAAEAAVGAPHGVAFMPSCEHASSAEGAERVARIARLLAQLTERTVHVLWRPDHLCCGGTAQRLGMPSAAASAAARVEQRAATAGLRISDCADTAGREGWTSLWSLLAEHADTLQALTADAPAARWAVHGGCRERRLHDTGADEHKVLRAVGVEPVPLAFTSGIDECCAGDPVYRNAQPGAAHRAAASLSDAFSAVDAPVVTSAARCAEHLSAAGLPVRLAIDLVLERCLP